MIIKFEIDTTNKIRTIMNIRAATNLEHKDAKDIADVILKKRIISAEDAQTLIALKTIFPSMSNQNAAIIIESMRLGRELQYKTTWLERFNPEAKEE